MTVTVIEQIITDEF